MGPRDEALISIDGEFMLGVGEKGEAVGWVQVMGLRMSLRRDG